MADEERQDDAQQPEDEQQQPEAQEPDAAADETPAGEAEDGAAADADDGPAAEADDGAAAEADEGPGAEAEEGAPAAEPESAPEPDQVEEAPEPDATPEETEPESAAAAAEETEPESAAAAAEESAEPSEAGTAEAGTEEPGDAQAEPAPERPRRRDRRQDQKTEEEVIPGAHLEPDLVLEEEQRPEDEYAAYAEDEAPLAEDVEGGTEVTEEEAPVAHTPLDLAADARYQATGKRKSAVARVTLKPGEGTYTVNGRHLDQFFPRLKLQRMAQQPLETAGYNNRMDVVARIHGGGVSAQAGALRHGIARALVEADPQLRTELKRRGFLTRDPRVKERKKAGLKKARKRPQFSKR